LPVLFAPTSTEWRPSLMSAERTPRKPEIFRRTICIRMFPRYMSHAFREVSLGEHAAEEFAVKRDVIKSWRVFFWPHHPQAGLNGLKIPFREVAPICFAGRKDFLPVEPQSGLSFLFLLGAPRFA
jgi:hypothetical protein